MQNKDEEASGRGCDLRKQAVYVGTAKCQAWIMEYYRAMECNRLSIFERDRATVRNLKTCDA